MECEFASQYILEVQVHSRAICTQRPKTKMAPTNLKCFQFDKILNNAYNLKKHLGVHSNVRLSECICKKMLAEPSKRLEHYRLHTRENPFFCKLCGDSFAHNVTSKLHIATHTGEKRCRCFMCNKSFTTKGYLNKHK